MKKYDADSGFRIFILTGLVFVLIGFWGCVSGKQHREREMNARINYNAGIAHLHAMKPQEAIRCFLEADHIISDDPMIKNGLGLAYLAQGKAESAVEYFRYGVRLADNIAEIHNNLACALIMTGNYEEALREAERAYRDPAYRKPAAALFNKAMAFKGLLRYSEARQALRDALERDPTYDEAHFQLAELLMRDNEIEEALSHFKRASQLNERFFDAHLGIAKSSLLLKRYDEAKEILEEIISTTPEQSQYHVDATRMLQSIPR